MPSGTRPGGSTRSPPPGAARQKGPPLSLVHWVHPEPNRQPVPVLGFQRDGRVPPEVPPDLRRHLEDHEFVSPRGESALPPELADLASDGHLASAAACKPSSSRP